MGQEHKHIYHAPSHDILKSYIGNTKTYGIEEKPDFRYSIYNSNYALKDLEIE